MTTTKNDLVSLVAQATGKSAQDTKPVIDALFNAVSTRIAERDTVKIVGFGTFETKATKARQGRNPQTGEPIEIAAGTKITFKPSAELKVRL